MTILRGSQLLCIVAASACVKQLPPAPTPAPTAPPVPAQAPPPNGYGRLLVDVVEGPTPVQNIRLKSEPKTNAQGRTSFRLIEAPELLCAKSPCVTDVPAGNVVLAFPIVGKNDVEVELVHVGPDPSVYRRSLSIYEDNTGATRVLGIIATAVGGASMVTGAVLLPVGLSKENDTMTAAGGITLGGGLVLVVLGILAMNADAPTFRPGSSNHFPLGGSQ